MKGHEFGPVANVVGGLLGTASAVFFAISAWPKLDQIFPHALLLLVSGIVIGLVNGSLSGVAAEAVVEALRLPWTGWGEGKRIQTGGEALLVVLVTIALPVAGFSFWDDAMGSRMGWMGGAVLWLMMTSFVSVFGVGFTAALCGALEERSVASRTAPSARTRAKRAPPR